MDQAINTRPDKKAAQSRHFKQLLLASLCAVIMACLVFFVFPRGPVSPGPVPMQSGQIAASISPTPEIETPAPTPSPTPDLSMWQGALDEAYGGDLGHWHLKPFELDQWRIWGEATTSTLLSTGVIDSTSTVENGRSKEYVALETVPVPSFGCRACDAVLGGAVLVENNGLWKVEDLQKFIVVGGTSGQLFVDPTHPAHIIQVGKDRMAIEYYDEIDAQGGSRWGWTTLYAYLANSRMYLK
jgi:hypothetical protein